ncbi:MAG: dihydroorotate dehydrogenase-like protein [Candidatus Omnitrophica bacterium]|nr:dihydroorotate dehydrogenase-like protein [Candidatus Omnitrophota bacterium]
MDLTTDYMGMTLKNPLVPSASPLSESIGNIKRMEDSGAAAVVLHSLFEEQLRLEQQELHHHLTEHTDSFAEALSFFPEPSEFSVGPEEYLNHIRKAKAAVSIPVIASLNGATPGGWTDYAKKMEQAGADAIELNIYNIPMDMDQSPNDIEKVYVEILKAVKKTVNIPVALKIGGFFTNPSYSIKKFADAGADAMVLFNRFYQPDIDLETLEIKSDVVLSTIHSMRLPLRWIAMLYGRVKCDFAATRGIHTAEDAIKMIMVGANVTMLCSVLMKQGIGQIKKIEEEMKAWMEEHEYESVGQMRGSMSQLYCDNPSVYERSQYIRVLKSYKPEFQTPYGA